MAWKYKGKNIKESDIPEDAYGFIYNIVCKETKKFYIGKKVLFFKRKKRLTKAEKLLPENKRKTFKTTVSASDWENYWGSCKDLLEDVKRLGEDKFTKTIIEFCPDKKRLTFKEVEYQIKNDVLTSNSYNGNILSRFFREKTILDAK